MLYFYFFYFFLTFARDIHASAMQNELRGKNRYFARHIRNIIYRYYSIFLLFVYIIKNVRLNYFERVYM